MKIGLLGASLRRSFVGLPFLSLGLLPLHLTSFQQTVVTLKHLVSKRGYVVYTVQPRDNLSLLAEQYGSSVHAIALVNHLPSDMVQPGEQLYIPLEQTNTRTPRLPPGVISYAVQPGDTLDGIADRYQLSFLDIVSANPGLPSLDQLYPGQILYLPLQQKGLLVEVGSDQNIVGIAHKYQVSVAYLARVNKITQPLALQPGDEVLIPDQFDRATLASLYKKQAREQKLAEELRLQRLRQQTWWWQQQARQILAEWRSPRYATRVKAYDRMLDYRPPLALQFSWPLYSYRVTSPFGFRRIWVAGSNFHDGVDLSAPYGTRIHAALSGKVIFAGWNDQGYGNLVMIQSPENVTILYAHQSRIAVRYGQAVQRGQTIGYVGSTGDSTGPHVHFEVRIDSVPTDPLYYLPH